jgi:hypothetical protein
VFGTAAINSGIVARIIETPAAKAGFDRDAVGGHTLKRGALTPARIAASTRPGSRDVCLICLTTAHTRLVLQGGSFPQCIYSHIEMS